MMFKLILLCVALLADPIHTVSNTNHYHHDHDDNTSPMDVKHSDTRGDAFSSKKILFILPTFFMTSHYLQMSLISHGLAGKGHQIDLLGNEITKDYPSIAGFNSTHALLYELHDIEGMVAKLEGYVRYTIQNGPGYAGMRFVGEVTKEISRECKEVFANSKLLTQLKDEHYDLIVTNLFYPCDALIARFLDVNFVAVTTSRAYPYMSGGTFGFPTELSYVPEMSVGLTDTMDFVERIHNVVLRFLYRYVFPTIYLSDFKNIQIDHDIDVDTPILDVMGKALLWISYSDLSLDFAGPTMPNFVRTGGMAVTTVKPLEKDLEVFVQGSGEHGVIIFSLGSMIGSFSDPKTTRMIASVFSRLPQRVIWRHTDAKPDNLGNNTMIVDWMPQNDLLGHPKTRLFIGHGGLNGVYEALYNAVPMILIPIMAPDQWDNAARVVSKGMGLQLDSLTITEDIFHNAVTEVLQNHKYKDNVSHYSAILRDLPPAKERAVFWIEHVMKFGDGHLRAKVFELNLIQYYLLDVAAFFLFIAVVVAMFVRFTCRLCYRACGGGTKQKVE